jgi:hypothetical protein
MITMSYGGGKQTVAIITLILEGKLPKPDLIVMADTSYEVTTTFEYLNQVVQPALKEIGLQVEIAGHDLAKHDLYKSGKLLLPAFTRQNGTVGKLPTFCSDEWKQRVIRRWLREKGVNDTDVWLGISLDEAERMKPSGLNWYRHIYPLIEILPMHRSQCVNQILSYGWKVPHKSRCKFCPNQSPLAWKQLKDLENGDFDLALALDAEIRTKDPNVYLHPSGLPLGKGVEQTERQSDMFDGCDSGYCLT